MEADAIFIDANVVLRALTVSDDPRVRRTNEIAGDLFRLVAQDRVEVTTSDAVIAEAAFVLTARAYYQIPVAEAVAKLATLVALRGFTLPDKRSILRGLDLWAAHPHLGFVDALTAAYAQASGMPLATFDSDFDRFPGITRWDPSEMT
jgi:predicted nucleic acid-binding protein